MKHLTRQFIPIVLCAGFGTRLRPLSYCVPKVVAPIGNEPIAFTSIRRFLDAGFEVVHCNTHYLAETVEAEIRAALVAFGYDTNRVRFWREIEILNSGGGIQRIWESLCCEDASHKSRDVIAVSGDLFCKIPLEEMCLAWISKSSRDSCLISTKQLLEARLDVTWVDLNKRLIRGFGRDCSAEDSFIARNFTGQQIISSKCLSRATVEIKSSVDMYFRAALTRGDSLMHFEYDESFYWYNIGTYEEFLDAMKDPAVRGVWSVDVADCSVAATNKDIRLTVPTRTRLSVNTLRTIPKLQNVDFVETVKSVVKNGIVCANKTILNPHALVFGLNLEAIGAAHLGLCNPLLIPIEFFNPGPLLAYSPTQPYQTSQTYLLIH